MQLYHILLQLDLDFYKKKTIFWKGLQRYYSTVLLLAVFPSTYFVCILEYRIKKTAGRKCQDAHKFKKSALKKVCAQLSRINFLSDKKKHAQTTMETHLLSKFHYGIQKSCDLHDGTG